MTKEKSIAGGEVEALAIIIDALEKAESAHICAEGCRSCNSRDYSSAFAAVDEIKSRLQDHLKTTAQPKLAIDYSCRKTTVEDEKGVDPDALKKKVPYPHATDKAEIRENGEVISWNDCIDHLASTGRIRGEWQSLGFLSGHVAFKVKGGYFDSAYSQIHGMKNDESTVVYKEQANPDVDPPYRLVDDLSVGIKNPTHFMPLPAAPGGE